MENQRPLNSLFCTCPFGAQRTISLTLLSSVARINTLENCDEPKTWIQIAAVLFGLQGLCFVLAATFFGANVGVYVPIGVSNFTAASVFLQLSFRSGPNDDK